MGGPSPVGKKGLAPAGKRLDCRGCLAATGAKGGKRRRLLPIAVERKGKGAAGILRFSHQGLPILFR